MATSDEDPGRRKQGEKVDNDATNLFQNDGSFLEMFKKRMEASPSVTTTTTTISTKDSNQDTKGQYDTTYFAPQTITYKKETESNGPAKKPQYQVTRAVIVGPCVRSFEPDSLLSCRLGCLVISDFYISKDTVHKI